ncbi:MAG: HAD-IC family P-type ATPase [Gammaproteobacteria bacterium]|nr:HAD-IC family P-type ATPase [Gammaproteobacteria bacterium]
MSKWYQIGTEEVLKELNTSPDTGLSNNEVKARQDRHGKNEIVFKKTPKWIKFLLQFNDPMVIILLFAAAVTGTMSAFGAHMLPDTLVILAVVFLNAVLGYIQEEKADAAINALKNMMVAKCLVIRDGQQVQIESTDLVPGDIIRLETGDKIPADIRLLSTSNLHVDEASLTGESNAVSKHTNAIDGEDLVPGDCLNLGFSGTNVVQGTAKAVVIETARNTEFGKIATMVAAAEGNKTPLQKKMGEFIHTLIKAILIIGSVCFAYSLYLGFDSGYSFLGAVSLVVAAIPEMLPALLTAILALAGTIMAKNKALVKSLPAAETLGAVSYICSDKTGTLTENKMTVVKAYAGGQVFDISGTGYDIKGEFLHNGLSHEITPELNKLLQIGFHCNNSHIKNNGDIQGSPTESAIKVAAIKAGLSDERATTLETIPFDSKWKYMATLTQIGEKKYIFLKGAADVVLAMCSGSENVEKVIDEFAHQALRVLGFAFKEVENTQEDLDHENLTELTFAGLQGIIDPPKESAIEAISQCKKAGIRTVMITGDHPNTALAIAKQLGISAERAITGAQLSEIDMAELQEKVKSVSVFARVAPEHKRDIAIALKLNGEVVAMTGDGVNDAPALKEADIGVAMGITGTEVAKEASEMILTDDNFATIVKSVEYGRHVWDSIRRAILYTLPTNAAQSLLIFGALVAAGFSIQVFSVRFVLEPVQILWINLVDSILYTMPLMMEAMRKDLLSVPPRDPKIKIIDHLFLKRVILIGIAIFAPAFAIYYYYGSAAVVNNEIVDALLLTQSQTAAFWAIMFAHVGYLISARSIDKSAFTMNPFGNLWIIAGISLGILTHAMATYIPVVAEVMKLAPFPVEWWPWVLCSFFMPLLAIEVLKMLRW